MTTLGDALAAIGIGAILGFLLLLEFQKQQEDRHSNLMQSGRRIVLNIKLPIGKLTRQEKQFLSGTWRSHEHSS